MKTKVWLASVLWTGISAGAALAQVEAAPESSENFGSDTNFEVFSYMDFLPDSSAVGYTNSSSALPSGRTRYTTSVDAVLSTPANRFPNGAYIEGFDLYFYDDSTSNFFFNFCRNIRDTATSGDPTTQCLASFQSSGTPGNDYALVTIPSEAARTIRYRFDWDGDGTVETANYFIEVDTPGFDGGVRIASVRARWRRQVSPSPVTATFPNDVPTNHPFFQFVEALAGAGITAGCAPNTYCVDNPITRGEMAVFLAAALGLHWPGF